MTQNGVDLTIIDAEPILAFLMNEDGREAEDESEVSIASSERSSAIVCQRTSSCPEIGDRRFTQENNETSFRVYCPVDRGRLADWGDQGQRVV